MAGICITVVVLRKVRRARPRSTRREGERWHWDFYPKLLSSGGIHQSSVSGRQLDNLVLNIFKSGWTCLDCQMDHWMGIINSGVIQASKLCSGYCVIHGVEPENHFGRVLMGFLREEPESLTVLLGPRREPCDLRK